MGRIHQRKGRFLPGIWWKSAIFPGEIGTFTILSTFQTIFASSFPFFPCRFLAHRLELSSFFSVRPEHSQFSCGFFVQMSRIPQRFLCKNLIPPLLCNLTITDRKTLSNLYQSFFDSLLQPDEKAGILDTVAMVKKITMLSSAPQRSRHCALFTCISFTPVAVPAERYASASYHSLKIL